MFKYEKEDQIPRGNQLMQELKNENSNICILYIHLHKIRIKISKDFTLFPGLKHLCLDWERGASDRSPVSRLFEPARAPQLRGSDRGTRRVGSPLIYGQCIDSPPTGTNINDQICFYVGRRTIYNIIEINNLFVSKLPWICSCS